ncbi:Polysaccharide pyruvyl transferase [Fibrobacter sp. UWH5]|uniref:polysaccharide pyruvyl transferase family protein n=1 Tax=Fibrobacter sp. UWH5 TaxID=1896211 RepID=UPI000911A0F3|nr:polysaccharide pyruvyl transferase family protein [Fibrobacter sp. UWH5]SHK30009.1 Polysaccharide pyruvyl transferase [Fibrobacter sp. UWH5]
MKIAIVTQPLFQNYGGILQNYALQKVLKQLGHQPETIDQPPLIAPLWMFFLSWIKTILLFFIPGKKRNFAKIPSTKRLPYFESFILKYLNTSNPSKHFSKRLIRDNHFEAIVVGSDQVWRPKYNHSIENMFLKFTGRHSIKRIAYAASFGVKKWEFTKIQTLRCSKLVKLFDAISVREKSGIDLCNKHLGVHADLVLDPTLLLDKNDYLNLCSNISVKSESYIAAYILDLNDEIKKLCEDVATEKKIPIKYFSAEKNAKYSLQEWLALFRDASYVVTDSFHGTIFSIIFEKKFNCVYNDDRGAARFESLLNLYNSGKLEEMRQFSLNWLKKALES